MVFFMLIAVLPVFLFAGTTGKMAGVVKDSETGDPLIGANVQILNTPLGDASDENGNFVILNVPVGRHDVKVSYMGYTSVIKEEVRVSVDLTTDVVFSLTPAAIEGETVVITAERPLIRKDETNTNIIRTAEEIKDLPVRGLANLTATVAGVVKLDNSGTMNVRGGRGNETAVYVDGVLVNDPYNFANRSYVPNEAIEELSVQTGGFNAEYGEAMSGIVIMTTNAGTKEYHGSAQIITDAFMPWDKKFLGTYCYGYDEYTATFGGPIIPNQNHTFFLSATRGFKRDGAPSWGWAENNNKPDYYPNLIQVDDTTTVDARVLSGFNDKKGVVPGQSDGIWSYTGKLKFQLTKSMELRASAVYTDRLYSFTGGWTGMNPLYLFDVEHAPVTETQHLSVNATFTHMIGPKTFYDLKFNYFDTYRSFYDRMFEDDLLKYGDPTLVPDTAWANNAENWGTAYTARLAPDFYKPGAPFDRYFKNETQYWGIDFDMTHQLGKYNTFKFGMDYKYHTLREFYAIQPSALAKKTDVTDLERYQNADIRFYGYDIDGKKIDDGDYLEDVVRDENGTITDGYKKQAPYNPILMSAYFQDKIEFEDIILNIGLRYDRIDPNAWVYRDIEAELDENGQVVPGTGLFHGKRYFDKSDTKESEAFDFISPRLGIAFPISENTVFHAQYGRFYQKPDLQDLYLSPFYLDSYVSTGGYFTTLDNPSLKPERTTSYEIGFKQMLGMNMSVQLTAFYKETEDLVRERNVQTDLRKIAFMFNEDFGVVKGFDVILTLRRTRNLSATINYEYQTARGTGTSSTTMHQIAWQDEDIPKFVMPLEFEQKHTGTVNVDYRLRDKEGVEVFGIHPFENAGINLLFSFNSGRPYTGKKNLSQLPHAGRYDNDYIYTTPSTPVGSEVTPWNYRFDLKVDKVFKLPFLNAELKAFIWVLNLLNTETAVWVWPVTGLPNETGFMQTTYGQEYYGNLDPEAQKAFNLREIDYLNYGIPRQIRGGLMITF